MPATHSAWQGPDLIRHLAPDITSYDAYLCGPIPWMADLERDLRHAGLAPERIHSEAFTI
jgi:ferredoxin-NADP reductase